MPVLGISGGIASGKSTVCRLLAEGLRYGKRLVETFSADECGHDLLDNDPVVQAELQTMFGTSVISRNGRPDRVLLRQIVFDDPRARKQLEEILHPKIRETWVKAAERFRGTDNYFLAEIPLLYETNSAFFFDCVVVVEAGAQVQLARLSSKRGWSLETARRVIDSQLPSREKMRQADILIFNHHTEKLLHDQIELAARALQSRYA